MSPILPFVVGWFLACSDSTGTPDGTEATVVAVTVTPETDSLSSVGDTVRFSATARDSLQQTIAGTRFTWTSSKTDVATVSSQGRATAVAPGVTTISAATGGISGSASLTVLPSPPPTVTSVTVDPANDTLAGAGDTLRFIATALDASNAEIAGLTFDWSSTDDGVATVDANGLATAVEDGTTTIQATTAGVSGTASLTVAAPPPGGGTILFQDGFESDDFAGRGWYDMRSTPTTTTAEAKSGSRSLEIHFFQDSVAPPSRGFRHLFTGSRSVYVSYWVKYSASWEGSGHSYHPHEFMIVTNEENAYVGPAFTHLTAYIEHNYQNGGIPVLALQDAANIDTANIGVDLTALTEDRAVAGCNGEADGYATDCYSIGGGLYANGKIWKADQPYFLPDSGAGYKGNWHFVEAYFELNSIQNGIGQADGIARYWFDGELVMDYSDVLFRTATHAAMAFNQFFIAFHIGDGSPVDQTAWVDDLTVATAKP